tara:strand:+ start:2848 stop:3030 length:183 start_codon:yes stop_codon:yes gene_type:complete
MLELRTIFEDIFLSLPYYVLDANITSSEVEGGKLCARSDEVEVVETRTQNEVEVDELCAD